MDLVKAIHPNGKYKIIGLRPGEKIHEDLITKADSLSHMKEKIFLYIP